MSKPWSEAGSAARNDHAEVLGRCHRLRHRAMNTSFEILADHPDATYARQAARAAFEDLDRLETRLSRFLDGSDVRRLNQAPAALPVRIGPEAFACLTEAIRLHERTAGAFDASLGTGLTRLSLDPATLTVCKAHQETRIDLGGIGKGFALDQMANLLADWDLSRVCLTGGGSSILALEPPTGLEGWPVGLGTGDGSFPILLHRASLGASGTGAQGDHIRDPSDPGRTLPARRTWVCTRLAAWSDALATAFMILPREAIAAICREIPECAALIEHYEPAGTRRTFFGQPALQPRGGFRST